MSQQTGRLCPRLILFSLHYSPTLTMMRQMHPVSRQCSTYEVGFHMIFPNTIFRLFVACSLDFGFQWIRFTLQICIIYWLTLCQNSFTTSWWCCMLNNVDAGSALSEWCTSYEGIVVTDCFIPGENCELAYWYAICVWCSPRQTHSWLQWCSSQTDVVPFKFPGRGLFFFMCNFLVEIYCG